MNGARALIFLFVRCTFSNCSVAKTTKMGKCIGSKELDRAREVIGKIAREGDCITLHPGFQDVCLN